MDESQETNRLSLSSLSSLSVPSTRPSITLPSRSAVDHLFTGGGSETDASPGPMTLVSNFFSENDPDSDCRSFSQLLSGSVTGGVTGGGLLPAEDGGGRRGGGNVDFQFVAGGDGGGRPAGLVVSQPAVFTIPPGMSPASLLDSPAGFFTQGSLGVSHQQALPQVTRHAAQVHTDQLLQVHSFNSKLTTYQPLQSAIPDHNTTREMSNIPPVAVDKPADDGYNWRKYGQKQVKGSEYPRSYYKCTHPNCPVKKQVERSVEGLVTEIIYKGQHNHLKPQSRRGKDGSGEQVSEGQMGNFSQQGDGRSMHVSGLKDQESSQGGYEHSGSSYSDEAGDEVSRVDERHEDEPQVKKRNIEMRGLDPVSSHRVEPRIIVQTTSEVDLLDDGYRWRKYGQKVVKGNPHPRSYYKCTNQGCNVRKHVERAASDPKAVITTYEGKHTHDVPAAKNSSHTLAATSQVQPPHHAPNPMIRRPEYPNRQQPPPPTAVLHFKEEQIT